MDNINGKTQLLLFNLLDHWQNINTTYTTDFVPYCLIHVTIGKMGISVFKLNGGQKPDYLNTA